MSIITQWSEAPKMDTGAPMPSIRMLDGRVLVCAYTVSKPTMPKSNGDEFALVVFRGVTQFTFGYPNDEVLGEHPLYPDGIAFYAFNFIENSPTIDALGQRNEIAFPGSKSRWTTGKKHYLVAFHDETLEVICREVTYVGNIVAECADKAIDVMIAKQAAGLNGSPTAGSPS